MKLKTLQSLQSLIIVVAIFAGLIYGLFASWNFTFGTIVPWLEMPKDLEKLVGLLIWFFVAGEIGVAVFTVLFMVGGKIVAGLLGLMVKPFCRQPSHR